MDLVDAILCNHAETVNGLLYLSGGGIARANVPPQLSAPYHVAVGIGLIVNVPAKDTGVEHFIDIELLDGTGTPVEYAGEDGATGRLRVRLEFNVAPLPGAQADEDQQTCLAANFPGFPLPKLGNYSFVLRLDEVEQRRLPFKLIVSSV